MNDDCEAALVKAQRTITAPKATREEMFAAQAAVDVYGDRGASRAVALMIGERIGAELEGALGSKTAQEQRSKLTLTEYMKRRRGL